MTAAAANVRRIEKYMDFTSPESTHGLGIQVHIKGGSALSEVVIPESMAGWRGPDQTFAHNGVVATILDTVMAFGGINFLKRATVTKSISVEYFTQVPVKAKLQAEAKLLQKRGDSEAILESELRNDRGVVMARAIGTYALYSPEQLRNVSQTSFPERLLAPGINLAALRSVSACGREDLTIFENNLKSL